MAVTELFPEWSSPEQLDTQVRVSLSASIRHIFERAEKILKVNASSVEQAMNTLEQRRVSPGVYGRYYELVPAIASKQFDRARDLFAEMIVETNTPAVFSVLPYTKEQLGDDFERYNRLIDLGAETPALLAEPNESDWQRFADDFDAAMALIGAADPALQAEKDSLVIEVIAAAPGQKARFGFGGASSMMLWGAILLNVERHDTPLKIAEGVVHETSHQLLFGLSVDEPLVLNDVRDAYDSPLRNDLRPMDGVYHATFVCARLSYFYHRLLEQDRLDAADTELARRLYKLNREHFFTGLNSIERDGDVTPLGKRILEPAHEMMAALS